MSQDRRTTSSEGDSINPCHGQGSVEARTREPIHGVFSKEGEFWTIAFGADLFRLKDSKGLAYIAHLLRFPGTEFHALDLVGGTSLEFDDPQEDAAGRRSSLARGDTMLATEGLHVAGLGDAGEILDDQAKAEYRKRIRELRDELEEAKTLGNVERAEKAEAEIDALTVELSRAIGLGGRNRRAASASERARQSATRAIKAAIERIRENNEQLGSMLARCIKTGTSCAFHPDPAIAIEWGFVAPVGGNNLGINESAAAPNLGATGSVEEFSTPAIPAWSSRSQVRFVGREAEFAQLWSIAEGALGGSGAVILLAGGPGVGKTRFARELATRASQSGFEVFRGGCYERDDPHPLMPFVEIIEAAMAQAPSLGWFRQVLGSDAVELAQIAPVLRRVFPDLPPVPDLPSAQVRRFLFQSLFDFLSRVSRIKPLLLVLEDLHWADESTLALLNFVANRIEQIPAIVLATYRDSELDTNPALKRTIEELLRLGIRPTRLRGLSRSAVAEIVSALSQRRPPGQLVNLIFEETQGNPFFVEEVFSHLVEEGKIFDCDGNFLASIESDELVVPDNVRLVLGRRLARLSENSRQVLSAASVIGRSFSFRLLESVLDRMTPDELFEGVEEAQRGGIIMSSSQGPEAPLAFSHELVRQTLLVGLSPPRRQSLHLKIAQAIENQDARTADRATEIAHHLVKSGAIADPAKTSRYLALAGESAVRAGAYDDARRNLEGALSYKQADLAIRAELLSNLATAERGVGNWSAALAHLDESLGLYADIGDHEMIGAIVFEMVEGLLWTGRFNEAARIAERGMTHLSRDEGGYRARLLAAVGLIHAVRGYFDAAIRSFDEALASAAGTHEGRILARILAYRAVCDFYFFQLKDALEHARKSSELCTSEDCPWTHSIALSRVMLALYHLGRPDEAVRIGIELQPTARKVGQLAALSYSTSIQAWREFGRRPDLAVLDARISDDLAINRAARVPLFLAPSLAQMSLVKFFAGDWDSARSLADEGCAAELPGAFRGMSEAMLLRLAAYSDDNHGVSELLSRARSQLPSPHQPSTIGAWSLLTSAVESLAMIGERGKAAELYPLTQDLLESGSVCLSFVCRFPATIAGISAGAAGEWELAENHFQSALQLAEQFPNRLEQAEVCRFQAMMLLERKKNGDRERACGMLTRALEFYDKARMPRHRDLTQALLARATR